MALRATMPGWIPSILRPDYVWPCPVKATITSTTPPIPKIKSAIMMRIWGMIHEVLLEPFSLVYANWTGADFEPACRPLPFGLVLKRTERVRLEEVVAMDMARRAGIPAPKVISYGEHPNHGARFSILMTRMPGRMLSYYAPDDKLEEVTDDNDFAWELGSAWIEELNRCLEAIYSWSNPHGQDCVSSVLGTKITTTRVPRHAMGPFPKNGEIALLEYLQSTASSREYPSLDAYDKDLAQVQKLAEKKFGLAFSHGDLMAHNILIDEHGKLSAILDWECAGWYPKYWEYTTVLRMNMGWWAKVVTHLGGDRYLAEAEHEKALMRLTWDSYVG